MNHFRRIVRALRSSHRAAGHLNLTGAQLFVVNVIGDAGGPLSVNDVAQRTGTDQSTVSVVTNRLVERGLLKRERSTEDSRRVHLSLTASGRALQKKAPVTIAQQRMTAALQELSPRDAAELLQLLEKIVTSMDIGAEHAGMLFDDAAPESPDVDSIPRQRSAKRATRPPRKR
jgi:DNA-binding MarR family transcriptional regulator